MLRIYNKKIGNVVRLKRVNLKLSQKELADLAGVTRDHIGRIERNQVNISLKLALKISRIFNCNVDEIFFY